MGRVPGRARATPPNFASLLLQEICALSGPTSQLQLSPRRGAGGGRCLARSESALAPSASDLKVVGQSGLGGLPTSWLRGSKSSSHPRPLAWGWAGPQTESARSLASSSGSWEIFALGLETQVPLPQYGRNLFLSLLRAQQVRGG